MGRISAGVGLISNINYKDIIDQLMALEARPKDLLQTRIDSTTAQKLAFTDLRTRLTSLRLNATTLKKPSTFANATTTSSDENVLSATASNSASPGSYQFQVARVVSTQQSVSDGFADYDTTKVGAGTLTIEHGGGELASSTSLAQLNGGSGVHRGSFRITDRSGASAIIDTTAAVTLEDVVRSINTALNISVRATIRQQGLVLSDNSGGAGNFKVQDLGTGSTASDLGIVSNTGLPTITGASINYLGSATLLSQLNDERGVRVAGSVADFRVTFSDNSTVDVNLSSAKTIGGVISAINTAGAGKLSAAVSGNKITLADTSGLGGAFTVSALNSSKAAADLGIAGSGTGTLTGSAILSGLGTTLISSLKGGSGLTLGSFTIQNRAGVSAPIDLSAASTVQDIIDTINASGLSVEASLNAAGNGIRIADGSGGSGNLIISDDVGSTIATQLGIAGTYDTSVDAVSGSNLQRQYINENTLLSTYNGGRGVAAGSIKITNSAGGVATIDLGAARTLADVISKINTAKTASNSSLNVAASINANGDGLLLTDTAGGANKLTVAEVSGTTAADLNIKGSATATTIDGSFEKTITIAASDTLSSVQTKINDLGFGARAAIINDGSGAAPYRLSLSASNSGYAGRFTFDAGATSLETQTLVEAQDAAVFVGSSAAAQPLLITASNNQVQGIVPGLTINLHSVSSSPVTVNVARSADAAVEQINQFTTAFNDLVDKIGELTQFDPDPDKRGLLLGDSTVQQIQSGIYTAFSTVVTGGRYRVLGDVGIKLTDGAKITFDEEKFRTAYATDSDAVQRLFTAIESTTDKDGDPVTVGKGVAYTIESRLTSLIDPANGVITLEDQTLDARTLQFQDRIKDLDSILTQKRTRLEIQFAQLERVLAGLQSQQASITQLSNIKLPAA